MNINDKPTDFARFVELQQDYTKAHTELQKLEVEINSGAQKAMESKAVDYVVLQEVLSGYDRELKSLFEKYPEWRGDKKSVSTPYGSVEQRTATELEVENPALTVALIKARGQTDKTFNPPDFLHVEEEPNLEALERLDADALGKLGVKRVSTERITVKPAKVNVAKAVKAAKAKQPATAEAA